MNQEIYEMVEEIIEIGSAEDLKWASEYLGKESDLKHESSKIRKVAS